MNRLAAALTLLLAAPAAAQYTPHLLVDAVPGVGSSAPYDFAEAGGKAYFTAQNSTVNGTDLWAYDPAMGTMTVQADMRPGGYSASRLLGIGGTLYFPYRPTSSTLRFAAFDPATKTFTPQSNALSVPWMPTAFAFLGGKVYFTGDAALYVFDPVAKTLALAFSTSSTTPRSLSIAAAFDGKMYFSGTTTAQGRELYVFDPATGQHAIAVDQTPGAASSNTGIGPVVGGRLLVTSDSPTGNAQSLWALSPGATALTPLTPVDAAPFGVFNPVALGDKVVFVGNRDDVGSEPWVYDLATGTTSLLGDIESGPTGSAMQGLVVFDGKVFFSAATAATGNELWYTDGRSAPHPVGEVNPGPNNGVDATYYSPPVAAGNRLFFRGTTAAAGMEPWYLEGQPVAAGDDARPDGPMLTVAPNPARAAAAATLTLGAPLAATVAVHDLLGRERARLHDGPMAAGTHRLPLDASALVPGVYLVRVATGTSTTTTRLTVVR